MKKNSSSNAGGHVFFGFGLGPIQAGLFIREAQESGNFSRIVVAEPDQELVNAIRKGNGVLRLNVAGQCGVRTEVISRVEIFNPNDPLDRPLLMEALRSATEIVTALPSVRIYEAGGDQSPAALMAEAFRDSAAAPFTLVYTAENDNHAAEKLEAAVIARLGGQPVRPVQFLNTVIGKMSQVLRDADSSDGRGLVALTDGFNRAFLVEEFNRILVTRCHLSGVRPGIEVFIEKEDLLPFEEAKLYGHNAVHALAGYLGKEKGLVSMDQALADPDIHELCRKAFIDESGRALVRRYAGFDPLFTPDGFAAYAEDLLVRIGNPHLTDAVDRIIRDPERKMGWSDR
ncbi:MAG: hypothetical protein IT583_01295 [Verrucomicrobia bacterium]|nr:hypothetical protein [Verrucomicrobiota bacterium]